MQIPVATYSPVTKYLPQALRDIPHMNDKAYVTQHFGDVRTLHQASQIFQITVGRRPSNVSPARPPLYEENRLLGARIRSTY